MKCHQSCNCDKIVSGEKKFLIVRKLKKVLSHFVNLLIRQLLKRQSNIFDRMLHIIIWYKRKLMKWQVDEMTSWWKDKLMKWQVDEMTTWWNDMLMKCLVDEMTSWRNDKSMKWKVFKMKSWWNERILKLRVCGKKSFWALTQLQQE